MDFQGPLTGIVGMYRDTEGLGFRDRGLSAQPIKWDYEQTSPGVGTYNLICNLFTT